MKFVRFRDDVSIKHSFMFTLKKLFSDGKNHSYKVLYRRILTIYHLGGVTFSLGEISKNFVHQDQDWSKRTGHFRNGQSVLK